MSIRDFVLCKNCFEYLGNHLDRQCLFSSTKFTIARCNNNRFIRRATDYANLFLCNCPVEYEFHNIVVTLETLSKLGVL